VNFERSGFGSGPPRLRTNGRALGEDTDPSPSEGSAFGRATLPLVGNGQASASPPSTRGRAGHCAGLTRDRAGRCAWWPGPPLPGPQAHHDGGTGDADRLPVDEERLREGRLAEGPDRCREVGAVLALPRPDGVAAGGEPAGRARERAGGSSTFDAEAGQRRDLAWSRRAQACASVLPCASARRVADGRLGASAGVR
jgi:hypothetical protein